AAFQGSEYCRCQACAAFLVCERTGDEALGSEECVDQTDESRQYLAHLARNLREYALPVAVGVVEPVPSNALENQVGGKESPAVCDGSRPPGEFRPGPRQFVTYQAQYLD